ncbi:SpoIIE family protein phosphatase [Streptomyces sp. NPDC006265]|uniref:SpoIIE family protein phosphatase n=1 Tax=Streptomyces sp. NPDC006265 TaxID=3156740 RepID=UPI0033AECD36
MIRRLPRASVAQAEPPSRPVQPPTRVLCFSDGLVEEHYTSGKEFGEDQLINGVNQLERTGCGIRAVTRALSHTLKQARGGHTTDDATLLMVEWRG